MMKRIAAVVFALALSAGAAYPQAAQIGSGQVWGNASAAQRNGKSETVTAIFDRALSSTQGALLYRNATTWVALSPGTAGLPLVSGGASANLSWAGLGVTGGGTGLTAASQGDLLYGSASNLLSRLSKNTTATRYLANTGTSNNPAWDQVNLANGVTGNLPVTNLNSGTSASSSTFWRGDGAWATPTSAPGGSNTQVQYNSSGSLAGISGVTSDGTAMTFASGDLKLSGSGSGTSILNAPATGGGTVTLPQGSVTLASITAADQVMAGGFVITSQQLSSGTITPDFGSRGLQWIINTGAFTITAPTPSTNVGYANLRVINGSGAGAVTLPTGSAQATSWAVGSNTGDTFSTSDKQSASCTATNASPAVFTYTAHGLPNGWPVYLSGSAAPTGFSLGTVYYTASVAPNTFQLAATPGGSPINSTSTGTSLSCHGASQYTLAMEQNIGGATYAWKALQ